MPLKPPELFLGGEYLQIARKLITVEEMPRWDELVKLFEYLDDSRPDGLKWHDFCFGMQVYHAFCDEFVRELAGEIRSLDVSGRIVEVAAGNGKLSYWLRQFDVQSIATDGYLTYMERKSEYVEYQTAGESFRKYNPELVIACWLPPSSAIGFRALNFPSVRYYLDIGEGPGGCTGSDWLWERNDVAYPYLDRANQFSLSAYDTTIQSRRSRATLFRKL